MTELGKKGVFLFHCIMGMIGNSSFLRGGVFLGRGGKKGEDGEENLGFDICMCI